MKEAVAFEPFGWLLAFAKTKAGSKAQPKAPYTIFIHIFQNVCLNKCDKAIIQETITYIISPLGFGKTHTRKCPLSTCRPMVEVIPTKS